MATVVSLKDYQIDAINRMKNGCILCGGVGSGKSRTSLGYFAMCSGAEPFSENPGNDISGISLEGFAPYKDLYIITTARKRDTYEWDEELIKFLLTTNKEKSIFGIEVKVDSWNNIEKYISVKNSFFIFDEQRVVGKGKWVKTFLKITKENEWILLSATPGDNWSDYIPVFIANGFFKNRSQFNLEHVIFSPTFTSYPKIDRYIGIRKLCRLRDKILVDMDFKRDTVSHDIEVRVEYDILNYKDVVRNRWNNFEDKPIENASEYCNVLRKIVNSDESRQVKLLEIFEKHSKVIVFYNYDYELDILVGLCQNNQIEFAQWNGHKHQDIPDCNKWMYLVQYNAGAEGWNCVKTDTIIFYSQSYSYRTMVQSKGRIDRMNTPFSDLYYYSFVSVSSIDIAIKRALRSKKKFNESRFF